MNPTSLSTPASPEQIQPAGAGDSAAIEALLAAAKLPCGDVLAHLADFLVWRVNGVVAGAVGMEVHGNDALLRSLVVAPANRGTGAGGALVRALTDRAQARRLDRFFLLTTTAAEFFTTRGFVPVDRALAPLAIAASNQFRGLCPASAVCLMARIADLAT